MQVVKEYPNGIFSWVDLMTTDTDGAKAFYRGLFGWDATDTPIPMGGTYTMFTIDGYTVCGMGEMNPDMKAAGMPPVWTAYVNHRDADAVASRVQAAGGTVMMPPMDVMEEGRMAMFQDPTGAVFGVWQPRNHIGAQLVNMPNTLVWNELQTRDVDGAKAFYGSVFGWTSQMDDNGYVVFSQDERVQAGMMAIQPEWGDMPPNWSTYFMVADVEAAVGKAQALGGTVMVPPTSAGEMGRFAVIQDPQGGAFTAMQFNGPVVSAAGIYQRIGCSYNYAGRVHLNIGGSSP